MKTISLDKDGTLVDDLPYNVEQRRIKQVAARFAQAEFATANCFCRKSILEKVGGFDERFHAGWPYDYNGNEAEWQLGPRRIPTRMAPDVYAAAVLIAEEDKVPR